MSLKYKILLLASNYITGKLISLKLNSYGHEVSVIEKDEAIEKLRQTESFDLLVLDQRSSLSSLQEIAITKLPVIIIASGQSHHLFDKNITLNLNFTEEEFLHKAIYINEHNKEIKTVKTLFETILSHYNGDKDLTEKVIKTFLKTWKAGIEDIAVSFVHDDDQSLAKKVHSFKGLLSALGKTEAAILIRKIEILIRGRRRDSANLIFQELRQLCEAFSVELNATLFSV